MDALELGITKIHFVGIGGSGIYPIVQILIELGYEISGSDVEESSTLERVRQLGASVFLEHTAAHIEGIELLVFSFAIPKSNPELIAARESGLKILSRAEILQLITSKFDHRICIAGTHGKTTTTALLTQIFLENNINTGAIIGGIFPMIGGAGRAGSFDVCVCEACEYSNTFLSLMPTISVVLNIDNDHLEFFGSMSRLINSFCEFCCKANHLVIYNGDDGNAQQAVLPARVRKISFGLKKSNDYYASDIKWFGFAKARFSLFKHGKNLGRFTFSIPGCHNIHNILAASVVATEFGLTTGELSAPLLNFEGVGRRFEILYNSKDVTVVDDYAHHPAEIRVTLKTAKQFGHKNVWAIFQPFTYSRTKMLINEFADVLSLADHCVIADIMGGREFNEENVSAMDLARKNCKFTHIAEFNNIVNYVIENKPPNTLVVTLGCGNIYKVGKLLAKKLKEMY
ncbi:MAG: UDP-N-acetylmuramate--L-alanine ligase [Oscillospiraceae bacterium]|jgi:UDP-N-acetylmuramate--alanine ligase|nr:UDP-N-acetylmuramate--L-alanine ligase [Oscillospiraceae bacterium]